MTPTLRTAEQTQIGIYWAYDGTPSLCAPPRLYNQIAMPIAHQMGTDTNALELARLLALVNVAMADTGTAVWESKYYYQYWRPVTGIREADEQTGPTGFGDGNPATAGDKTYLPLGAPASNLAGPNITPPFPAYPSGHAGFGGALFEMLRNYYRTDRIPFAFVSDEFNGVTRDNTGTVRPVVERSFSSLSGGRGEWAEPHLSRHPLGLRQDRGHRTRPPRGRLRVHTCHAAAASTKRWTARNTLPSVKQGVTLSRLGRGNSVHEFPPRCITLRRFSRLNA